MENRQIFRALTHFDAPGPQGYASELKVATLPDRRKSPEIPGDRIGESKLKLRWNKPRWSGAPD